jgi:hypothetical protein
MSQSDPDLNPTPGPSLTPTDAALFDALLATRAGGTAEGPLPPGTAESPGRAAAVRGLMRLLDTAGPADGSVAAEDDLVAATLAKVAAHDAAAEPVAVTLLSEDDGAALDAVLAAGGGPGPVPAGLGERAGKVREVLSLLDTLPREAAQDAAADEDLVRRTLAAAAEERQRRRFAEQVEMLAEPRRTLGVGWRQLASAAAVLLIAVSLLMPAIDRQRQHAQQMACATNLGIAGQQMNAYAADFAGMLPRGPVGNSWLRVGQDDAIDEAGRYQSNSAHLYLLIRAGYVAPARLACASNDAATAALPGSGQFDWASPAAISYSYQNQHGRSPINVYRATPTLALLADKSPLFVAEDGRMVFDADAARDARTLLHRGKAQNILTLDGRVRWSPEPTVGDDNIWQIRGHAGRYTGTETPADTHQDSFLVP